MSREDFYSVRKRYRQESRRTEREYSRQAVRKSTEAAKALPESIARDFSAGGDKISMGVQQGAQARENLRQGNIGNAAADFGTGALNVAGGAVGSLLSPFTGFAEAVTPDLGVTEAIMNTRAGQEIARLAQENPRTAQNLGNIAEIASVVPGMGMFGKAMNAVADNTPTKVKGFYDSPSPVSKAYATAKAVAPNLGYTLNQLFNPVAQAEKRVIGTGQGRRNEYVTKAGEGAGSFNEVTGNMQASAKIDTQQKYRTTPDPDTVAGSSAEVQRYTADWTDMANKDRVKSGLRIDDDTPDNVVDGAVDHLYNVHGTSDAPGETSLQIRKTQTGEGLDKEGGAGTVGGTGSASVNALKSPESLRIAKGAMPDAEPLEFYKEFIKVAKHSHKDRVNRARALNKLPKDITPGKLRDNYWSGIRNQKNNKELTKLQQQALDFFKDAKPVTLKDRGNGIYSFSDNHVSTAQDLGGVNDWIAIDINNNKAYTMISDGHDMFGMNPAGGNAHLTATPIRSFDIGKKQEKGESGGKKGPTDLSKIEELTGISRNKGESDTAYQARVLRDYKGTAKLEDYMNVGSNVVRTGMLAAGGKDEEQK